MACAQHAALSNALIFILLSVAIALRDHSHPLLALALSHPIPTMGQPTNFDKLSFVKYMKNIGRAYRKQATELVFLCRTFVQAQEQTPGSDVKLRR
jgi:hypothetical protein